VTGSEKAIKKLASEVFDSATVIDGRALDVVVKGLDGFQEQLKTKMDALVEQVFLAAHPFVTKTDPSGSRLFALAGRRSGRGRAREIVRRRMGGRVQVSGIAQVPSHGRRAGRAEITVGLRERHQVHRRVRHQPGGPRRRRRVQNARLRFRAERDRSEHYRLVAQRQGLYGYSRASDRPQRTRDHVSGAFSSFSTGKKD